MTANAPDAPYIKRAELGLYQQVWLQRFRIPWSRLAFLISANIRDTYGLILDEETDVVLDTSGFSYSDQWGPESTVLLARAVDRWKRYGAKIVLMPQAFGPFTTNRIRDAFRKVVERVDLIFARDHISYGHVIELAGKSDKVKMAPDFTNLLEGEMPEDFDRDSNRFCIIPNYRVAEKTKEEKGKGYISFVVSCATHLYDIGAKPFILIHEGEKDRQLGSLVAQRTGKSIAVIREENPLRLKGIIGASDGVLSSRFHGLVSAFSQGVPALATGWSHKYSMLLNDYHFSEGFLPVDTPLESLYSRLDSFVSLLQNGCLRSRISQAALVQKEASSRMWNDVFACILKS